MTEKQLINEQRKSPHAKKVFAFIKQLCEPSAVFRTVQTRLHFQEDANKDGKKRAGRSSALRPVKVKKYAHSCFSTEHTGRQKRRQITVRLFPATFPSWQKTSTRKRKCISSTQKSTYLILFYWPRSNSHLMKMVVTKVPLCGYCRITYMRHSLARLIAACTPKLSPHISYPPYATTNQDRTNLYVLTRRVSTTSSKNMLRIEQSLNMTCQIYATRQHNFPAVHRRPSHLGMHGG